MTAGPGFALSWFLVILIFDRQVMLINGHMGIIAEETYVCGHWIHQGH